MQYLFAKTIFLVLLLSGVSCSDRAQKPAYSESFLNQLAARSPDNLSSCYLREVQRRWPDQAALRDAVNKVRISRGQTDDVNFALKQLADKCVSDSD